MHSSPQWSDIFFRFDPESVSREYGVPIERISDHRLFIVSKRELELGSRHFISRGRYVYLPNAEEANILISKIEYPPGSSFWLRSSLKFFERHLNGTDIPAVMGIVNMTPDSFYPGSRVRENEIGEFLSHMKEGGVKIVDIGGQSTRPGSERIGAYEEMKRIRKAVEIALDSGFIVSIDSFYTSVIRECMEMGAHIINDVTGLEDPEMAHLSKKYDAPIIIMHKKGDFKTMQNSPYYENVIEEIISFFIRKIQNAREMGIEDNIVLDPGIGFGKRVEDNVSIIKNLRDLKLGFPLLIGLSRKSFIGSLTGEDVNERGFSSAIFNTIALMKGADIIRVHDIEESVKLAKIIKKINEF